jgi:ABC-type Fe3+-hydroxamate transport system substrate-binding protein
LSYRIEFGDTINECEVNRIIATTPSHLELLDAIEHLPSGGVLSLEDMPWSAYEELVEALGDYGGVRVAMTLDQDYIQGFNEVKRKFRKWVQANK